MRESTDTNFVASAVTQLLQAHCLEYEKGVYGKYEHITPNLAQTRFQKIWRWLTAACTDASSVTACHLILWPNETSLETSCVYAQTSDPNADKCESHARTCTPIDLLRELSSSSMPSLQKSKIDTSHAVLACYFLYKTADDAKAFKELGQLLFAPVFFLSSEGLLQSVDSIGKGITNLGQLSDIPKSLSPRARYYQRLAVVLTCESADVATEIANIARYVVGSLVTHWGQQIERGKEGIEGSSRHAGSITHEFAQVAEFLQSTSSSSDHLGNAILWKWERFDKYLRSLSEADQSLELSRLLVCPYADFYHAITSYVLLWADAKSASTPFDNWRQFTLAETLGAALQWAQGAGFAVWARKANWMKSSPRDARELWSRFRDAVNPQITFESSQIENANFFEFFGLAHHAPLMLTTQESVPPERVARRLAMLITATILNAVKHATQEREVIENSAKIGILVTADRIVVANGVELEPQDSFDQDGSDGVFGVLSDLLKSEKSGSIVGTKMGALADIGLPQKISNALFDDRCKYLFKTVIEIHRGSAT